MKMALSKLEKYFYIDKLVVHSLDLSLYQVSVVVDDQEFYVTDDNGEFLRAFSILELQRACSKLKVEKHVLRHQSAYDEMVGTSQRKGSNQLEVPLGNNKYY